MEEIEHWSAKKYKRIIQAMWKYALDGVTPEFHEGEEELSDLFKRIAEYVDKKREAYDGKQKVYKHLIG